MPLTDRQRHELNSAVLEYLIDNGFNATASTFEEEAEAQIPSVRMQMLEKKWSAVVRLQKKIQTLETELADAQQQLKESQPFMMRPVEERQSVLPTTEKFRLKGHQRAVNRIQFHPNTTWLASAGDEGNIGVWDYDAGRLCKWLRGHTDSVNSLCFNYNGTLLASASTDMSIKIWNFEDEFRCLRTLHGHDQTVSGVAFIGATGHLVSCSRDSTLKIWEVESGYCVRTLFGHEDWVRDVAASADGAFVVSCSSDQTVRLWNHVDGREQNVFRGHEHVVECVALCNDFVNQSLSGKESDELEGGPLRPKYLASGGRDRLIILWEIASGMALMRFNGHDNWIRGIVFHPGGKYLLSCGDDRSVRIWDLEKRRQHSVISDAHGLFVSTLDWNLTLPLLATGSSSKDIKIWSCE